MPEHVCLTADQIIQRLDGTTVPQEGLPTILHGLSTCPQCWEAIEELRNLRTGRKIAIRDPFAGFFATLITQKPRHATHRLALAKARDTRHGVYWLLLEEISAFLPYLEPEVGKSTLLLFELLLAEVEGEPPPDSYDLQVRTAALAGIFWNWFEGCRGKAQEELQKALELFEKGTGSQELRATILAAQAEFAGIRNLREAESHLLQAIELVPDLHERRIELLLQLGGTLTFHRSFERAWPHLLDAEDQAEGLARDFLQSVRTQLLTLESALSEMGDPVTAPLARCLANYHARCLQQDSSAPPAPVPALEHFPTDQRGGITALCTTWATGHDVSAEEWARAVRAMSHSETERHLFEAFRQRLIDLWGRYPDGRLAEDLLEPLVSHLEQLRPAA